MEAWASLVKMKRWKQWPPQSLSSQFPSQPNRKYTPPPKTNMTKNPPFEDDSVSYSKWGFSSVILILRGVVVLNTYSVLTKRSYHSSKWMLVVESNLFPKGPPARFFLDVLLVAYICLQDGWMDIPSFWHASTQTQPLICMQTPIKYIHKLCWQVMAMSTLCFTVSFSFPRKNW